MKKAVIAGATGLVGGELLKLLIQGSDYQEVLVLTRTEIPVSNKKLVQLIVDFDNLGEYLHAVKGDVIFCCLGSTIRKTPNLADYRKVDYIYPVQLAQIAKANQIKQYHLVSSIGANMHSSNFYTRMKGETEDAIVHTGLPCLHIYQPSALSGQRKEFRLKEKIALGFMKIIDPLLSGKFKKYRSIPAATVASAMYKQSLKPETGLYIHPSDHIKTLA